MSDAGYKSIKERVVQALSLIDPTKPHGTNLFNALARVTVSSGIEAVCLRRDPGLRKIKVLLVQRSLDDTAYAGEWHCPGSILRPGEEFSDVFNRLGKLEFKGSVFPKQLVGHYNNVHEQRGHFLSIIYLCETDGASGTWHTVDSLPENTVDHHRNFVIPMAVKKFNDLGL